MFLLTKYISAEKSAVETTDQMFQLGQANSKFSTLASVIIKADLAKLLSDKGHSPFLHQQINSLPPFLVMLFTKLFSRICPSHICVLA